MEFDLLFFYSLRIKYYAAEQKSRVLAFAMVELYLVIEKIYPGGLKTKQDVKLTVNIFKTILFLIDAC